MEYNPKELDDYLEASKHPKIKRGEGFATTGYEDLEPFIKGKTQAEEEHLKAMVDWLYEVEKKDKVLIPLSRKVLHSEEKVTKRSILRMLSGHLKPSSVIRSCSFLIPKTYRVAFIGDLYELTEDMRESGCWKIWIFSVTIWHLSLGVLSSMKLKLKERLGLHSETQSETNK